MMGMIKFYLYEIISWEWKEIVMNWMWIKIFCVDIFKWWVEF